MMCRQDGPCGLDSSAFIGLSRHRLGQLVAEPPGRGRRRGVRLRARRRGTGSGPRAPGPDHDLAFTDRVLVTLAVLRLQIPHAALAVMYGVHRSTVTRAVREIRPLLAGRGLPPGRARRSGCTPWRTCSPTPPPAASSCGSTAGRSRSAARKRTGPAAGVRVGQEKAEHHQVHRDLRPARPHPGDATFRPGRMHDQTALQTDGIDDLLNGSPAVQARSTPATGPAPRPSRPGPASRR